MPWGRKRWGGWKSQPRKRRWYDDDVGRSEWRRMRDDLSSVFPGVINAPGPAPPDREALRLVMESDSDDNEGADDFNGEEVTYGTVRGDVVGKQFYSGSVNTGEMVALQREPNNIYDKNAIRVTNVDGDQVGHIKRQLAVPLAFIMDNGLCRIDATIPSGSTNVFSMPVLLTFWGSSENRQKVVDKLRYSGYYMTESAANEASANKNKYQSQPLSSSYRTVLTTAEMKNELDNLFENLKEGDKTTESEPCKAIATKLFPHQKQALHWMISRENRDNLPPFWEKQRNGEYFNSLTHYSTRRKPKPVRGGILADDMGLGKTLEVIALILSNFINEKPLAVPVEGFLRQSRVARDMRRRMYRASGRTFYSPRKRDRMRDNTSACLNRLNNARRKLSDNENKPTSANASSAAAGAVPGDDSVMAAATSGVCAYDYDDLPDITEDGDTEIDDSCSTTDADCSATDVDENSEIIDDDDDDDGDDDGDDDVVIEDNDKTLSGEDDIMNDDDDDGNVLVRKEDPTFAPYEAMKINPYNLPSRSRSTRIVRKPAKYVYSSGEENNNEDSVEKEDGKEKQPNEEETPIAFTSEAVVAPSTALVDTATAKTLAANVNGAMELEVQVTATLRSKKDNAIVSSTTQSSTVELENVTNKLVVMSATRTAVLDAMSPNPSSSPSSSSKEIELRGRAPEIGVVAAAETLLTLPVAAATQPASCDVNTAPQTVPMPDSLDPPRTKTGSMLDAVNPLAAKTGLMPDPVNPFATETGAVPDSVNPSATKSDPIPGPPNPSATKPVFEVNTSSAINHESQTFKTQTIEVRSMSRPRRNARKPARFLDDGETENHSTHIPDKSEMTKKTRGRRKKRKSDEDDQDWKPAEKFIKTETSFPGLQSTDPPLPNLVLPKPEPVTPVSSGASTPAVSDPPLPNLVLPKPEPVTPVSSGASTFAVLDPPLPNLVLPKPETVTPVSSRTTTIPVLDLPSPNLVLPQPELVTPGSTNSHSVTEDKTSLPLSTGANRNVQFINSTKPATATSLVVYGNGFDVLDSSKVPSAINEEIVCDDGTDSSDRRMVIYDGPPRTTSPIAISDESDDAVAAPTVLSSDNSPDVSVTKITTNKRRSSSRDKKDPVYVIDSDDDFDLPDVSAMFARFDRPAPQPSATVKTLTVKATPSGMITAATVRKASASFGVTEKPSASFGASEKSSASVGVTEKPAGKAGKGKGKSKGKNAKGKTNWTPDDDSISTPSTGLCGSASGRATHFGTRGTLIVCPLSVLSNWVDQLEEHVDARVHLAIYSYYGPQRCKRVALLEKQDIVLTTYMTLATDWREANNPKTMTKSPLHEVKWLRVVLDEGHIIRNPKAQQTKAIVDLTAERRWVLTGTPIQNSIKDFWSLMNFLRVKPFTDHTWWSRTIERPITRGEESAFRRVQHLMTNVALRRTKNQIVDGRPLVALPSRTVVKETIAFSDEERKIYDAMHTEGRLIISRYCRQGTLLHHYGEVLTILLRLRQICCHPFLVTKAAKVSMQTAKDLAALSRADDADVPEAELRQRLINNLLAVLSSGSDEECSVCLDSLKDAVITHCAHVFCRACIVGALRAADGGATSGPCPLCRAPVDERRLVNVPPESERPAEPVVIQTDNGPWHSSAKVDACMKALLAVREEDASLKSIVVSQFTSYLTVLETPLRTNGFKFVRFDGTMSQKQRTTAIEVFSDPDPASPTIFLMSLKAGGVGLNLTAASRVFLLDPAWNPASEEQCFDRCHRLGQTRDVIITKFIIEDSVEERMLELQEKKRRLAQGAFAKKQTAAERRQMRTADIQNLMSITTADVNQAVGPMVPLGGGPVVTVNRNLRFV